MLEFGSKYRVCFGEQLLIKRSGLFKTSIVLTLNYTEIIGFEYKAPLEGKKWYQIGLRYLYWTILTGLFSVFSITDDWPSNRKVLSVTYHVNDEIATSSFETKLDPKAFKKIQQLLDEKQRISV